MRYEGRHKLSKVIGSSTTSRVNIAQTIAINNQLNFAIRIHADSGFSNNINYGRISILINSRNCLIEFNNSIYIKEDFRETSWIIIVGTKYKKGMFLWTGVTDITRDPKFGEIKLILIHNNCRKVLFICTTFDFLYEHKNSIV